jgi:DNA-binding NtrC family response regulator
MAKGDELLIVDATAGHREGMKKLFEGEGYVCTAVGTSSDARDNVVKKFFPAAVVDVDVERAGAGLDLVRLIRERSPKTAIVVVSVRRTFELAVEAFREGALDVVLKKPEQVDYLKQRVAVAVDRHRLEQGDAGMLADVSSVLDQSFRIMLKMARHVYHDVSVGAMANFRPRVLFVESDQEFVQEIAGLIQDKGWEVGAEMNGGAALDKASSQNFDLVVVRENLMDLRGSMVIRSVQTRRAETLGLLYSDPGPEGRMERYAEGRSIDIVRPFESAAQLIAKVDELVGELGTTQLDRRVIQAFRGDNEDFFRRYAELKLNIDRMLD